MNNYIFFSNIKVFFGQKDLEHLYCFFVPLYRININNYRFYNRLLIERSGLNGMKVFFIGTKNKEIK